MSLYMLSNINILYECIWITCYLWNVGIILRINPCLGCPSMTQDEAVCSENVSYAHLLELFWFPCSTKLNDLLNWLLL